MAVDHHFGDIVFASSTIKRGEAYIVVTSTGDNTFVGRAAALVTAASAGSGHFTEGAYISPGQRRWRREMPLKWR
jgi:H+-transporting ATPase